MMESDSKSETSMECDTILSKIGKLTTAHSPRVISCVSMAFISIVATNRLKKIVKANATTI